MCNLAVGEDREFDQRVSGADAFRPRFHAGEVVRDGAGEFGHAVDLLHAGAAPGRQIAPLDFRRADRGAGRRDAQAGDVAIADRDVGQRAQRGRHVAGMGQAIFLDDAPEIRDQRRIARAGGAGNDDRGAGRQAGADADKQAADMEQRQRDHAAVALAVIQRHPRGDAGGDHRAVGQARDLGMAGGAAGRQHHGDAIGFRGIGGFAVIVAPGRIGLQHLAVERNACRRAERSRSA